MDQTINSVEHAEFAALICNNVAVEAFAADLRAQIDDSGD